MRKEVRRRHDAHVRANAVCSEQQAMFDATPGSQKARAALDTCVGDTNRLLALQQRSLEDRRAATAQLRLGRVALRRAIKAVVVVGRLVDAGDAIMHTMRLPRAVSDDELVADARGLLDRVTPYADAFVAEGLPPDLLKNLDEEIQRFGTAKDAQAGSGQRFSAAAVAIRETQNRADRRVAVLEAIAVITPTAPPEVVRRLRIAKRVGQRPAESAKPAPSPAPSAARTDTAA